MGDAEERMQVQGAPSATPAPSGADPADSDLVRAARGEPVRRHPVWFMRQAGRALPEYHRVRAGIPMLDACFSSDIVTEITLQPVRRYGVDAAILFSDIVVPLRAIGIDVEIRPGVGPVIAEPVRDAAGLTALRPIAAADVGPITDAVHRLVDELGTTPLIGFAGAPFTVASYLVEGGPSRDHAVTKALMHREPQLWHDLAGRLTDIAIGFLAAQLEAGASAFQLFDSWAGALSPADYTEFVLPHSRRVFSELASYGRPSIHFGVNTGELLALLADAGPDVVGVDWRVDLDDAARRITADGRPAKAVQGNLDPALLGAGWPVLEREVRRIVEQGRAAPGHIVNLGHGVPPSADPDVLTRIVELVHSLPVSGA